MKTTKNYYKSGELVGCWELEVEVLVHELNASRSARNLSKSNCISKQNQSNESNAVKCGQVKRSRSKEQPFHAGTAYSCMQVVGDCAGSFLTMKEPFFLPATFGFAGPRLQTAECSEFERSNTPGSRHGHPIQACISLSLSHKNSKSTVPNYELVVAAAVTVHTSTRTRTGYMRQRGNEQYGSVACHHQILYVTRDRRKSVGFARTARTCGGERYCVDFLTSSVTLHSQLYSITRKASTPYSSPTVVANQRVFAARSLCILAE
jgi:hypothetical protein